MISRVLSAVCILLLCSCTTVKEKPPAMYCPETKKVNQSPLNWNTEDDEAMRGVIKNQRCKYYYPELPCLKKFFKRAERTYHAECGKKVRR